MTKPRLVTPEGKARKIIDGMLEEEGWIVVEEDQPIPPKGNYAVEEVQTTSGPMDYGLFIDGDLLGVVEAKSESKSIPSVLVQSERYSKNYKKSQFNFNGFHIPFLYATNGHLIWFRDVRSQKNLPREIAKFHTPSALKTMIKTQTALSRNWLKNNPIDNNNLRDYQQSAIEDIEFAILNNKRKMLVAMATGTGKTVMAAELIYRLLKSKTAKRILFLVDRRALAAQAVNIFKSYEPEPGQKLGDQLYELYSQRFRKEDLDDSEGFNPQVLPNEYLTNPKSSHTFVYVSTIQRMRINLFGRKGVFPWTEEDYYEDDLGQLDIPIHAFDVIIADECHRGYTSSEESKWREVIDHFDAIKIGLTATPAKHTTAYFNDLIHNYPVTQAINENWLVDWDLVRIDSDIRMSGLFLKKDDEVQYIDLHTGERRYEHLEDQRAYDTTALERKAAAPQSNKLIVKEYAKYARNFKKEHGRFPKTIFFAVNDLPHVSHCDRLVEWLRQEFSEEGPDFVQKITGTVERTLEKIRRFRKVAEEPTITVTVDLLSTGIDVPCLEAIVFLRPIKSRILFEQMMGRGTRLNPDIGKTHFTVLDAVGVVDYFKTSTNFPEPFPSKPTRTYAEIINELNDNKNRDYNIKILTRRLLRISKNITAEGREKLEPFIPDGDISKFALDLSTNLENNWDETMNVLRNQSFQYEIQHYTRTKHDFVLAHHAEDIVTSTHFPIVVNGKGYKPDDYLEHFKKFLNENRNKIEALRILLKRPKDFNTELLEDLRKKLASSPQQFTEQNLRKAYGNNLTDIIGMIRSTMSNQPVKTTRERVEKAISKIQKHQKFSTGEKKWLELIANHLEYNLLLEQEHFAMIPFSIKGGWKKANRDFKDEHLDKIILKLNEVMVN